MRVAIVHDYVVQFGGAERTLLALSELFPEAPIYTFLYDRKKMSHWFGGKDIRPSFLNKLPSAIVKKHRLLLPLFPLVAQSMRLSGYDVVLSSSSAFAKGVRVDSGTVHIAYCYSPTRFLWDYKNKYLKDNYFSLLARIILYPFLFVLQVWDKHIAQKIDYWIAPSRTVQERIKKYYNAKAEIIYPPIDLPPLKKSHNKVYASDYFLVVSRLSAYKKIDLIIKTFNKIQLPLVIVGDGPEREKLQKIAKSNCICKGFVDDNELEELYQHARAVIVACEEDFGLIAAEAASYGKPTLAYKKGGITEWLESGKTGEFFDEQNEESLAQGVYKIMAHTYNATYLQKKSSSFSKKAFQDAILKSIQEKVQ